MSNIIEFRENNYDEAAAQRGFDRLIFGELLDETVDDTLTSKYDAEQLDKMLKIQERRLSRKSSFRDLLSDPQFVEALQEPVQLTDEEKAEMAALEEAYVNSFAAVGHIAT